jgi:hypothetical protein
VDYLRAGKINFSVGFALTAEVRQAIIDRPESAWALAVCQDRKPRTATDEPARSSSWRT